MAGASEPMPPPVSARAWQATISDYYRGGLTRRDSCAATVVARAHLLPRFKEGTRIVTAFDRHERLVCPEPHDVMRIRVGMTDRYVANTFGWPVPWLSGPVRWLYRARVAGTSVDGVVVTFRNGTVTGVAFAHRV